MNYLNNLPEINIDFGSFFKQQNLEKNLCWKKQIELQTNVFKTSLLDQTVAPSIDPLASFHNKLTLTSIAKCFDKAYTEVISSKTWTQILASYTYDETSIFGTLPRELIILIFEKNHEISLFDKFNNKLATQGTAPEYTEQILEMRASYISAQTLFSRDLKKEQNEQDKCFL